MGMAMKGQIGPYYDFIIFAVVIVAGGAIGMLMYTSGVSQVLSINMNDLNKVSEASTYGDYMDTLYVPRSVNLSEQRSAYNLGQEGGDLDWIRDQVPYADMESRIAGEMESRVDSKMRSYVEGANNTITCGVFADYSSSIGPENTELNAQDPFMRCEWSNNIATYGMSHSFVSAQSTSIFELADNMNNLMEETKSRLPAETQTDTGSGSVCSTLVSNPGGRSRDIARQNAMDNVLDKYRDVDDKSISSITLASGVEVSESSPDFDPGVSSATITDTNVKEDNCDCDEVPDEDGEGTHIECDGDTYSASAEYTLTDIAVSYTIRDTRKRILTEGGAEFLEFKAEYTDSLD